MICDTVAVVQRSVVGTTTTRLVVAMGRLRASVAGGRYRNLPNPSDSEARLQQGVRGGNDTEIRAGGMRAQDKRTVVLLDEFEKLINLKSFLGHDQVLNQPSTPLLQLSSNKFIVSELRHNARRPRNTSVSPVKSNACCLKIRCLTVAGDRRSENRLRMCGVAVTNTTAAHQACSHCPVEATGV
jgi:hypothetical protein